MAEAEGQGRGPLDAGHGGAGVQQGGEAEEDEGEEAGDEERQEAGRAHWRLTASARHSPARLAKDSPLGQTVRQEL